jgi:hypothetical protein
MNLTLAHSRTAARRLQLQGIAKETDVVASVTNHMLFYVINTLIRFAGIVS